MDAVAHQGKSQNKLNTKNVPGYPPPIFILFYFNARKHLFYYLTKQMPLPLIGIRM